MLKYLRRSKPYAFSLIELMITVGILSILASTAVVGFTHYVEKAKLSEIGPVMNTLIEFQVQHYLTPSLDPNQEPEPPCFFVSIGGNIQAYKGMEKGPWVYLHNTVYNTTPPTGLAEAGFRPVSSTVYGQYFMGSNNGMGEMTCNRNPGFGPRTYNHDGLQSHTLGAIDLDGDLTDTPMALNGWWTFAFHCTGFQRTITIQGAALRSDHLWGPSLQMQAANRVILRGQS